MSGIWGIWNLDGRPLERTAVSKLAATLAHRGSDAHDLWIQGPVALGCHLLRVTPEAATETQPVMGPSGVVAVFDGRLDNREELLSSLPLSLSLTAGSPDSEIVVAAYENWGEQFAERLNGDFALAIFDPNHRKLVVARDAIGLRPLYYCWTASRNAFFFASEIKALLSHPEVSTQPNADALADLLLGNRVLIPRGVTCFQGIQSVPPSHLATLTAGDFKMRRYWDFDPSRRIRLASFAEYAEAFRHHFETAVRRRMRSFHPVAVMVSGGLDSSAIFCTAQTLGRRAPQIHPSVVGISNTFPEGSRCDEQEYLAHIERDYDCEIRRIPAGSPGFIDGCETEIRCAEAPRLDLVWNNVQALHGSARRLGARVLISGHWGDEFLFDQHYLLDLLRAGRWARMWRDLAQFADWYPGIVDRQFFKRTFVRDLVRFYVPVRILSLLRGLRARILPKRNERSWYTEGFRRRVLPPFCARAKGEFATAHAWQLYQMARSGYYVACMEWNNKRSSTFGMDRAFPFLDRDLISFLMAIPGEMQMSHGIPKAILREGLRGVLPAAIAGRRGKADFTARVNDGVGQQLPQLLHWLGPKALSLKLGYIGKDSPSAIWDELKTVNSRQDAVSSWALKDILALELWLQLFFGDHHAVEIPQAVLHTKTDTNLAGVTG
jgi:asparagine synthase (glutamine-hydrolysing)